MYGSGYYGFHYWADAQAPQARTRRLRTFGFGSYGAHYYAPDAVAKLPRETRQKSYGFGAYGSHYWADAYAVQVRIQPLRTFGHGSYGSHYYAPDAFATGELYEFSLTGQYRLFNDFELSATGLYSALNDFELSATGLYSALNSFELSAAGLYQIGINEFELSASGNYKILEKFDSKLTGLYRIANSSDDRYELYHGINSEPDLNTIYQQFTALPFTTPALSVDDKHFFTLRKRNKYGLISQNVDSWSVDVAITGDENTTPPTSPNDIFMIPDAGGTMRISAVYDYVGDDPFADNWLIYLTSNGIDPNPLTDIPVSIAVYRSDGVAKLNFITAAFNHGDVIKILVRVAHTVESENTAIVTALADTTAPDSPEGGLLFGKISGLR